MKEGCAAIREFENSEVPMGIYVAQHGQDVAAGIFRICSLVCLGALFQGNYVSRKVAASDRDRLEFDLIP
jgi:hypothetical protein